MSDPVPGDDDSGQMWRSLGRLEEGMAQGHRERARLFEFHEAQQEVNVEHSRLLRDIDQRLAALTADKGTIADLTEGVADWRKTKAGALKVVAGVGLGGTVGGAGLGHFVTKIWERIVG